MSKNEITLYENPVYKALLKSFTEYTDFYEGNKDTINDKYLIAHEFEKRSAGASLLTTRKERTEYFNYTETIISRFISLCLRFDESSLEGVQELMGDHFKDVDGKGTTFVEFIKEQIAPLYFQYGWAYIHADSFNIDETSKAKAEARGKRPYLECWNPLNIKDWEYEEQVGANYKKLKFIRFEYEQIEPRANATDKPEIGYYSKVLSLEGKKVTQTIYKAKDYEKGKTKPKEIKWIDTGEASVIKIDKIPVVFLQKQSWIKRLIPVAKALHNYSSAWDNNNLYQAHRMTIVSGDLNKGANEAIINLGAWAKIDGSNVSIDTIDPAYPQSLIERYKNLQISFFQLAFNQTRVMNTDSKAVEGSDTQKEQKDDFLKMCESAIEDIECLVNKAIEIYARFKNKTVTELDDKFKLKLSKEITQEDVEEQLKIAMANMNLIELVPSWKKEYMKKVLSKQKLENEEQIIEDIDNLSEDNPTETLINGFLNAQEDTEETQTT